MADKEKEEGLNQIYDFDRRIDSLIVRVKKSKSNNSKKVISYYETFLKHHTPKPFSIATQEKILNRTLTILQWMDKEKKDFEKVNREFMEKFVEKYINKSKKYSDYSKKMFKSCLKKFYQWLKKMEGENYPPEVSWIKIERANSQKQVKPEDMLNDEDIEKMIKITEHPRDKAFLMMLSESGCRVGEILTLKIGNMNFDDRGTYFLVNGKTGQRRVRVVNATPFLHSWLEIHPEKENKEAPLWCVVGTSKNFSRDSNNGKNHKFNWSFALTYPAARNLIIRLAKKAGIEKPINPHNFRHSRATILGAAGLNESIMNQIMGWAQGSKMSGVYLHLSGKQTDDALLPALYGMKVEENKEKQPKMFPIKCISCGELNPYNAKRCKKCNTIIGSIKTTIDEKKREIEFETMKKKMKIIEKSANAFEELSQNQEFLNFLKMFKATGGASAEELEYLREKAAEIEEDQAIERRMKKPVEVVITKSVRDKLNQNWAKVVKNVKK